MKFLACGVLVAVAACTSPNPKSCLDGSCTDPRYPFCDENGAIADEPKTCVAVSCTAGEVLECRGDVAVTCSVDENNYNLVECPEGCDASGCIEPPNCTTNADCVTATAPICDAAANQCHGCTAHDDCESATCNTDGSCEPVSNVVFASPSGDAGGACTKAAPCTLTRAITVELGVPTKVLRMLPGTYAEALKFDVVTANLVRVVAAGAILGTTSQLIVTNGAKVHIEELESRSAAPTGGGAINQCGNASTNFPVSTMVLERSRILSSGGNSALSVQRCIATLDRVDLEVNSSYAFDITSSTFIADRIHIHGNGSRFWSMFGKEQRLQVTNSLIEGTNPNFGALDTSPTVSSFLLAFNTFVFDGDTQFYCPAVGDSGNKIIRVENNIIVALGTQNTAINTPETCMPTATNPMNSLSHNLLFPFTGAAGTNIVMDPKFANAATRDFHILANSPAHDAAVPSSDLTTDHDYVGAGRTGTLDIGAYELP